MIFDTHAHYDSREFEEDRDEVLQKIYDSGVNRIVNVGASMKGCENTMKLAERYSFVYGAVGIHPDDCEDMDDSWIRRLRELAASDRCVAIGEIGLDYHGYDIYEHKTSKEKQQYWFRRQLEMAADIHMPVIVHSRSAAEDTLRTMEWAHGELGIDRAIIHCFSYSREIAGKYLDMGYFLGFGGSATYEGQRKISKVLKRTPVSRILLETDCPYLTPVPHRGERNDSRMLTFVRDKISEIKEMDPGELEKQTYENACRFYGVS